jgi:hypothetical protein
MCDILTLHMKIAILGEFVPIFLCSVNKWDVKGKILINTS